MSISTSTDQPPDPASEIAELFPNKQTWSVDEYFELTNGENHRIEFDNGRIEVLPMPTEVHEAIVHFLLFAMHDFISQKKLGRVYCTGIRVRTLEEKYRLPDIVFMRKENRERRTNDFWHGADLVMEVVSPDHGSRVRDLKKKRDEYAAAGIPEYWIVDPDEQHIRVLSLKDGSYVEPQPFVTGAKAASVLLSGFEVAVQDVFAAAEEE